ncbi:MAG: hypothetical protein GY865_17300 [candidate division Zixibacteria bacterium]|nr:hypothetical protein [candidate division Zixibacteria bacterium]
MPVLAAILVVLVVQVNQVDAQAGPVSQIKSEFMMQFTYIKKIFIIFLILLTAISVMANQKSGQAEYYNPLDLGLEFNINRGFTSNLLTDSSDVEDSYTTSSLRLKMYPVSTLEVILFGDYSNYVNTSNLNGFSKGVSFTFIPTNQNSNLSSYLSVSFSGRTYKEDLRDFNNNSFKLMTSNGYRLGKAFSVRTGVKLESTSYLYSDSPDKDSYEIFVGTNFTPLGSNSFDIEVGYTGLRYSFIPDTTYMLTDSPTGSYDYFHVKGDLFSYYISPRLSRPIGSKTGISITFHHREFYNGDNAVVLGSAVNFISPMGNVYEGQSLTVAIKTKLVPKMIISGGFGYWKKSFLRTMVITDLYPASFAEKRNDEQNRIFVIIERPIYFKSGGSLKPKLQFDIINNNTTSISMFELYDYSSFSINASLTYEL